MKSTFQISTWMVALLLGAIASLHAASLPLPRSTPEAQGISSQAIRDYVAASDKINTLHSFMLLRHGQVIAEGWWKPEAADKPHVLNSVMQKGKWNGRQLLPEKWVAQATSKQVPNDQESHAKMGPDWRQGYGFQFWRCTHNAFRGDGAAGQLCVVMPDQDAVVAVTSDTGEMQGELDAIWDKLLPAFQAGALPEDAAAQEQLKQAIAKLEAHPAKKPN